MHALSFASQFFSPTGEAPGARGLPKGERQPAGRRSACGEVRRFSSVLEMKETNRTGLDSVKTGFEEVTALVFCSNFFSPALLLYLQGSSAVSPDRGRRSSADIKGDVRLFGQVSLRVPRRSAIRRNAPLMFLPLDRLSSQRVL